MWHQPCNNQSALLMDYVGGCSEAHLVKLESFIQSHIGPQCSGLAWKQKLVLYGCNCEALRTQPSMRWLTNVHVKKNVFK